MSIRHYNPRRRRRGGISPKARNFLGALVLFFIFLQISYPLIEGESLRIVTITTVLVGALVAVVHGHLSYGFKYSSRYLPIAFAFGLGIEVLGVHTGWPFGYYKYDQSLGLAIAGVPLIVPFAWTMLAHPLLIAARRINPRWSAVIGGFGLMAWDLFLDPQMVRDGRWSWANPDPYIPFMPEIPASNALGWFLSGILLMSLLHLVLPRQRRRAGSETTVADIFLTWTWISGIIANLFFFSRPGIAFIGGVALGIIVVPYLISQWFARP